MRRLAILLLPLVVALVGVTPAVAVTPPPTGTDVDYQLGGVRTVPASVGIVVRDREARPAPDRYNVCYVNGFQTQPGERALWRRHPRLVLRDGHGRPVVDEAWGEQLLDVRTTAKRTKLAAIVGRWTRGCARAGYDAVEYDNLDSFTRSGGLVKRREAVAYARLLVRAAHRAGLAAGQKNLADLDGTKVGFDFAVAEECGRYRECGTYVRHYGRHVLAIEYRGADFRWTCPAYGARLAVVLRDRDLSPTGVRRFC
ncbi:endo alpha-1,4 polygalactosaminidase [Nocardioides sp. URHA0020]|uniref:endo alpha-1,4 polygalactosaminidase n=1 Tax=Nocardioides sp. URHA0020 TaxID=1380392 RepID=UPI0006856421|nr:endo alpha-1,4 polygalactosaminidase [Nocardioides sp. URHA0020]